MLYQIFQIRFFNGSVSNPIHLDVPNEAQDPRTQDPADMLLRIRNRYDNIKVVGDLNCDLSGPEKHDKQGRGFLDLMEVYNMSNMIKQPT